MTKPLPPSPFDGVAWPERLRTHVVTVGASPRIHGYDVESDLARHYTMLDQMVLALTGELPEEASAAAIDVALQFLAPVTAAQAPSHAAILARVCSGESSAIVATAALALTEQTRDLLDRHAAWLRWLSSPEGAAPSAAMANGDDDARAARRLRAALEARRAKFPESVKAHDLGREAAALAVLHACGLASRAVLEALLVTVRLPITVSEAFATEPNSYRTYPLNLPPIVYEEP